MPTLDATIGGVNANSYQDQNSAKTAYFDLLTTADPVRIKWESVTSDERDGALIGACAWLETLVCWRDAKTTAMQALSQPMGQSSVAIHPQVLRAHAMLAGHILTDPSWFSQDKDLVASESFGPISTQYKETARKARLPRNVQLALTGIGFISKPNHAFVGGW